MFNNIILTYFYYRHAAPVVCRKNSFQRLRQSFRALRYIYYHHGLDTRELRSEDSNLDQLLYHLDSNYIYKVLVFRLIYF